MEKTAFYNNLNSDVRSKTSHRCGHFCLGPLTFHCQAVGDAVRLSQGSRHAEKMRNTFKNGLVFSSRPVRVQERIRLRVEKTVSHWHGALRVGFTSVPPSGRPLPLPTIAIPNLTDQPGHWAAPVNEFYCQAGSELEFWVSYGGSMYIRSNNRQYKLLSGVDLSQPLWAMIDIYGATCSVFLLGSGKKSMCCTRRSCPAPECITSPDADNHCSLIPDVSSLCGSTDECLSSLDTEIPAGEDSIMDCVVCFDKEARVTLPCGHRCLCHYCSSRVRQMFGICPLCRTDCISGGTVGVLSS
ncbi:E3 ubiquitin-protein ligase NEURL3 [Pempheris klunzingeri]|uniref:E3 ubiquitin-protein ligase NEURL3 n=1 Tax=Pempheris klunzingeri TaxID=3127111 RepID=UPI00397FCA08